MRTPVFELHIKPMFSATDRDHMGFSLNLWAYDDVVAHADHIIERLEEDMPPTSTGGPWPQEWIDLFRRWAEGARKRLELGTGQYTVTHSASAITVKVIGTFPAAGYTGWLQLESETDTAKTYVLYFEPPDALGEGTPEEFTIKERYSPSDSRTLFIHDSTGVHQQQ
ncbi:hypothetical protein M2271_004511 [Streptomyces sp. LBL]|uniref:hypothetical protein n=1 Tax=Streptomyces sp. LBL TaxID=2940562 RepID=UPI002474E822|nr:hypothetical protein [Streptomyces sp. LBL]MDH6626694.1 hypothetical protein [Streptomyces sp. LBL]